MVELADQWVRSDDPVRRECGYGLLYEASKFSGRKAPGEEFFLAHVERIAGRIGTESEQVRLSIASGECEPFDVVKHLTSDRLKEKLRV